MGALIDTDVLIDLERGASSGAWRALPEDELFVCATSVMELQIGVEYARDDKRRAAREEFLHEIVLKRFEFIALDVDIAVGAGRLFHLLEASGQRIGHADTWIAATALTLGHQVVTANLDHFRRVPGLSLFPWRK
jgi:tRNA(fMet)-specific endonuclease VapC